MEDRAGFEPHASGMVDVGDGHRVYWEASGNPAGKPALVLHGGPGSGSSPAHPRSVSDLNWSHAAFLDDGQLLRDAPRLAGIPGVIINGRLDISGPPDTAWHLARAWPDAELILVGDAGHGAGPASTFEAIIRATARFAERP